MLDDGDGDGDSDSVADPRTGMRQYQVRGREGERLVV
jgi:hypothetical protein